MTFHSHMMLFMVLLVVTIHISHQDNTLYVSEGNGLAEASCGSMTAPCKNLEQAVSKCNKGGQVIVQGVQTLSSPIEITKDISIVGHGGATITGNIAKVAFNVAFSNDFQKIGERKKFTILYMKFVEISIISVRSNSFVSIINCSVTHAVISKEKLNERLSKTGTWIPETTADKIEEALIKVLNTATGAVLQVANTSFIGWQQGFVIKVKRTQKVTTSITFEGCTFMDNLGIYLDNIQNVGLNMNNCVFYNNTCFALYMSGIRGSHNSVSITSSYFSKNKRCLFRKKGNPESYGGAVIIKHVYSIVISNSTFKNCTTAWKLRGAIPFFSGGAINIFRSRGSIVIKRSVFDKNFASVRGGDIDFQDAIEVALTDCIFSNSEAVESGGSISAKITGKTGKMVLSNCTFMNNRVRGSNNTFMKSRMRGRGRGGAITIHKTKGSIAIKRSVFYKNYATAKGGDIDFAEASDVTFTDCTFSHSRTRGTGGSISIGSRSRVVFSNCTFLNNTAEGLGGGVSYLSLTGMNTLPSIMFSNCTFFGNEALKGGGAIAFRHACGASYIQSCKFHVNSANAGGGGGVMVRMLVQKVGAETFIYNSVFQNNEAIVGGGVFATKEKSWTEEDRRIKTPPQSVSMHSCEFINNSATSTGQSVYTSSHVQMTNILVNVFEKYIAPHLSLDVGDIRLQNVSLKLSRGNLYSLSSKSRGVELKSKDIMFSRGLTVTCPINFNVDEWKIISEQITSSDGPRWSDNKKREETKYKLFSVDCVACPYASYSTGSGNFYLGALSTKVPPANKAIVSAQKCDPCPAGAKCETTVKAVDNFWGYAHGSRLIFMLCPQGYCCGIQTVPCTSINTCAPGRIGLLCGSCKPGYKQNFIGQDCIPKGEVCNKQVFVMHFIVYTIAYTLVFVLVTNAKDVILCLKARLSKNDPVIEAPLGANRNELPISGFVQMTILFFQVASLLQVKFQGGHQTVSSFSGGVREIISDFFRFRFTIYQQLCPSDDLTLPQKEIILVNMKMATFLHLILLAIAYAACHGLQRFLKQRRSPRSTASSEGPSIELMSSMTGEKHPSKQFDRHEEVLPKLSFMNMLKFTFIKLLKLYYAPVTKSALILVHCVTIHDESHLYVYGDHVCYSGWQWGILFIVLPSLLLFPVCFQLLLHSLKNRQISSWQFVFAAACPYYAFIFYLRKRIRNCKELNTAAVLSYSKEDYFFQQTILKGEELLFRETEGHSLGWQLVQLYRTFIITVISTFIINPIYRQLAYAALLLMFIIHDRDRKPYKHQYLNLLQTLSSRCLLLVLICNVIPAMSYFVNVRTIPSIYEVVKILGILELMIYAVVPLSLPIWKLKSYIDTRHKVRKE